MPRTDRSRTMMISPSRRDIIRLDHMDIDPSHDRFVGFRLLVSDEQWERISQAHICVVGLGGVGSWAVEALARSGVGAITLVDLDEVCVTNINRQLHALSSTIGMSKAQILSDRISQINPCCKVRVIKKFFSASTADDILREPYTLVLDTIDSVEHKILLLAECVRRGIPAITVGSAGNRLTPHLARVEDLSKTIHDPLLQIVRKRLRQEHGFPRSERTRFEIPCVYAPLQRGAEEEAPAACPTVEAGEARSTNGKSCNSGLGSAVFVTGTIGFMAAAEVINYFSKDPPSVPYTWAERKRLRLEEPA